MTMAVRLTRRTLTSLLLILIILSAIYSYILIIPITTRKDGKPFQSLDIRELENRELKVYIVEEHHEVIPYWFETFNSSSLPKIGNTLIHIDGHSDMGYPEYFRKYPFFKLPASRKDFDFMMQENDVFIVSAAMSGFISKIVWIWPRWDEEDHSEEGWSREWLDFGWAEVDTIIPHLKRKVFCMCFDDIEKNQSTRKCNRQAVMSDKEKYRNKDVEIDPSTCKIQTSVIYEEFNEDIAVQKIILNERVLTGRGIILDIDEDFYGCTYASQPLLDAGVTGKQLMEINGVLSQFLCPKNAQEELESDSILSEIIMAIRSSGCYKIDKKGNSSKFCSSSLNSVNDKFSDMFLNQKKHLICKQLKLAENLKFKIQAVVSNFTKTVRQMNENKLLALDRVGFCSTSTPTKGLNLVFTSEFKICQGRNSPNKTMVIEHRTDSAEITRRSSLLQNILTSLKPNLTPNVVTLCRSSRDGFTPREHLKRIESDILLAIGGVFRNAKTYYDKELLGGVEGWANRRK